MSGDHGARIPRKSSGDHGARIPLDGCAAADVDHGARICGGNHYPYGVNLPLRSRVVTYMGPVGHRRVTVAPTPMYMTLTSGQAQNKPPASCRVISEFGNLSTPEQVTRFVGTLDEFAAATDAQIFGADR